MAVRSLPGSPCPVLLFFPDPFVVVENVVGTKIDNLACMSFDFGRIIWLLCNSARF